MTYGYRPSEIGLILGAEEKPDPSYRLRSRSANFNNSDRKPVRKSLGCHFDGAALPVPDLRYAPDQVAGATKRVAAKMPTINRTKLRKFKRFVRRWCVKYLSGHIFKSDEAFDFYEWIENTPYEAYRKNELIAVYENLGNRRPRTKVKSFIKDEPYERFKHVRGIYSRDDEYKVRVGPFFQKVGDIIFSLPWFIKKIPIYKRPAWLLNKFADTPNLFCTDFSQYEATFVKELMNVELIVYRFLLQGHPQSKDILDAISSGMMSKNFIQFYEWSMTLTCKRMSGEMNTSVGNGIINLLMTHFILEDIGNKCYNSAFEGDDSLNSYDVKAPTKQDYADLGAVIKIEFPKSLCEASFCGQIFDPEDLDIVANPCEALVSFGWTKSQYMCAKANTLLTLLKSKSLSMLYEYSGCPILRSLALYGLRMTNKITLEQVTIQKKKEKQSLYDKEEWLELLDNYDDNPMFNNFVKSNTRLLVQEKFGISVVLQLQLEEYLDNKNDLSPIVFEPLKEQCDKDWIQYFEMYSVPTPKFEIKEYRDIPQVVVSTGHKCKYYLNPQWYVLV